MADIDKILSDPDFLALSEQEQEAFIDQLRQQDFGKIPSSNNLLNRAIESIKQRSISGAVGGIPSAVADSRPEDALTTVAQFGTDAALKSTPQGRIASLIPGVPMAATVGTTTAAEGIKQFTKGLRGEKQDYSRVGNTAGITAATEGIGRTAENILFRGPIGKAAISGAKKRLGGALTSLFEAAKKNPNISMAKDDLLGMLETLYERIPFKIGPQAGGFRKVINTIDNDFPPVLGPQEIAHTENMLGDIASFDPTRAGQLKNKVANINVKEARSHTSGVLEDMGMEAGIPEVKLASKEAHMAQKKYASKKQGLADIVSNRVTRPGVIGATVGKTTGNPLLGFGAAGADLIFQSEPVKNFLYNLIVRSGLSRSTRVGATQVLKEG